MDYALKNFKKEKPEKTEDYALNRMKKRAEKEKKEKEAFDKTPEGIAQLKKKRAEQNRINESKIAEILHKREKNVNSTKEDIKSAKFRKNLYRKLFNKNRKK